MQHDPSIRVYDKTALRLADFCYVWDAFALRRIQTIGLFWCSDYLKTVL